MKVGLIVECATGGPDAFIYADVFRKLCPTATVLQPLTMGNKGNLLIEGALNAKTFLDTGADYVFIVWDKERVGNCEHDNAHLIEELNALGVPLEKIRLNCIFETLESLLIADNQAINGFVASITKHDVTRFDDHKTPAEQTAALQRIKKYFRDHYSKLNFNKYIHSVKIYNQLPELNRVRNWNTSFGHYCNTIEQICV